MLLRRPCAGLPDAPGSQLSEARIQLDTEPVPVNLLGGDGGGTGAEERVQHQAGLALGVTVTEVL